MQSDDFGKGVSLLHGHLGPENDVGRFLNTSPSTVKKVSHKKAVKGLLDKKGKKKK